MRIYIAGPYRDPTTSGVDRNIGVARDVMAELLRLGHTPFCPHAMTARCERDYPDLPDEVYLRTDMEWLRLCEAVVLLPRWDKSSGTAAEVDEAERLGLTIYHDIEAVPPAERRP